jgi:hypothetical protein
VVLCARRVLNTKSVTDSTVPNPRRMTWLGASTGASDAVSEPGRKLGATDLAMTPKRLYERVLVVALIAASCTACMSGHSSARTEWSKTVAGVKFVQATSGLLARCRATAGVLGYPIPCPMLVPAGLAGWPRGEEIIGPATQKQEEALVNQPGCPACARLRGWAFGSSAPPHLVILASPRLLTNLHAAIDGPGFIPNSVVGRRGCFPRGGRCHPLLKRLGAVSAHGWRVYLVEATPWDESAFTHHLVMVWTVSGHTYAAGFHEVQGRAAARRWDAELLSGLRLVSPPQ